MEHLSAVEGLVPRIRELAPTTEIERRLPAELAEEFGRFGVWRSCVPHSVGGRQDDLMTVLQTITRLSAADGAAGWCAMIGATSGVVYAYLDSDVGQQIFSGYPDV